MNMIRETMRLIVTTDLSNRMIGRTIKLSHNTIKRYRQIIEQKKLVWESIDQMDDGQIEALLKTQRYRVDKKVMPDWVEVHQEMQHPHVTLHLLWEEYRLANPGRAYAYSQFTHYYRIYVNKLDVTMRQNHRAGECAFVDFAGKTIKYVDIASREEHQAQVFVGVLGCSNYTFVMAVRSQSISDWIEAHNRMFYFFGGTPQVIIPDNLKAAVIRAGREPVLNRTYLEMSKHYTCVVVPARAGRPQDKAKAEVGVQLATRWITAKLRHRRFFSIDEINEAIANLLPELNDKPFKRLPDCRRVRFEQLEKALLKPLPASRFEYAEWHSARKVGPDYHLAVNGHYYSVPHELVGMKLETRSTVSAIEFLHKGKRVSSHIRHHEVGGNSTLPEHQPKAHRHYAEQTPERLAEWSRRIGPSAEAVVQFQFDSRPHPLLGLKACSTLRRLAKEYGNDRFEIACKRAEKIGSMTVKSVRSILQRGLTELTDDRAPIQVNLPFHENVRGAEYYTSGGY